MNNIIKTLIALTFCITLYSCEPTTVEIELPYVEKIQVMGVLESGFPIQQIFIRRTLPPLDEYIPENAFVKNATVVVTDDLGKVYNFIYDSQDCYINSEIKPEIGRKYKLEVTYKNLKAYAETYIPAPTDTISTGTEIIKQNVENYNISLKNYFIIIKTLPNTAYFMETYSYFPDNRYSEYQLTDNKSNQIKLIYFQSYNFNGTFAEPHDITVSIKSFDPKFYNFYSTRYNGDSQDSFLGGGSKIDWNVTGTAIGYFVGSSKYKFKID